MTDDLENALSFAYAIFGAKTVEEAADIWRLNPEARMQAHRAIYERKPRDEPYDEMMARLRPEMKEPTDWSEYEDEIADAISDSIDMDWSSRDGARAVVRFLNTITPAGRATLENPHD